MTTEQTNTKILPGTSVHKFHYNKEANDFAKKKKYMKVNKEKERSKLRVTQLQTFVNLSTIA